VGVAETDVVIVGTRCAGTAAAIAFARAGRRVIGLDSSSFPSDTLSTHLLWSSGVFELRQLGALERVRALGAPPLTTGMAAGAGHVVAAPFTPYGGIDYSMCVRRVGLDAALVDTARKAGADLREQVRVDELLWDDGRVRGVRYHDRDGTSHEIRARLVVGADGRRSTVAKLVGTAAPYRRSASGRACFYGYWEDTGDHDRSVAAQWRAGRLLGTAFPCDDGLVLCLIQPPADTAPRGVVRIEQSYRDMIGRIPGLATRLAGSTLRGRIRSAVDIASYFRRSSGPGWALPGDAGHFKDPVTAQGIRDALRYGRLLGEATAHVLDDPVALDRRLAEWELRREADCLEIYQYTNRLARGTEMNPLEIELYREAASDPRLAVAVMETISRVRAPRHMIAPTRTLLLAGRALHHADDPRSALRAIALEARDTLTERCERSRAHHFGLTPLPEAPTNPVPVDMNS
jgi:flavin-dependent dehydrogenase